MPGVDKRKPIAYSTGCFDGMAPRSWTFWFMQAQRWIELDRRLAQPGERLVYTQQVGGSYPSPPTTVADDLLRDTSAVVRRPDS